MPTIEILTDSLFIELLLADHAHLYIADMVDMPAQEEPPAGIVEYLDMPTSMIMQMDPCTELYLNNYLPAYRHLEATNSGSTDRCPDHALFTPLYSVEDFINSNLCCSDTGLVILGKYLERFYNDTLDCPGALPMLSACSQDGSAMQAFSTVEMEQVAYSPIVIEDPECHRLYSIWQDRMKRYHQSQYYYITYINIPYEHVTIDMFINDGLCDCVRQYVEYINTYLSYGPPAPLPPDAISIHDFCHNPDPDCCTLWHLLAQTITAYDSSFYYGNFNHPVDLEFRDCTELVNSKLCDCVPAYLTYLQFYIDWNGSQGEPSPPMSLTQFCRGPVGDGCASSYFRYVEGLVELQPLLEQANTMFNANWQFFWWPEQYFTSQYACHCVDAYLAYAEDLLTQAMVTNDSSILGGANEPQWTNISKFCTPPPHCDPPPLYQPIPNIPIAPECACCDDHEAAILLGAESLYSQYRDSLYNDLTERYNSTCMEALETFVMSFPQREYHYTLYYHDQAGNLIRTVPPEGVQTLEITSSTDQEAMEIAADRANATHTVFTSHRLPSDHLYNSLGQPIRSTMPDHDRMPVWETALPAGLPHELLITDTWFGEGGVGYLTGYQEITPGHTRGYVYRTADGGKVWQRLNGLLGSDLNDVYFRHEYSGYAVGEHGTFIRTSDGGSTWDLVPNELLAQGASLQGVHFTNFGNGLVVGKSGYNGYSTDFGNTFSTISLIGAPDLTDIGLDRYRPCSERRHLPEHAQWRDASPQCWWHLKH